MAAGLCLCGLQTGVHAWLVTRASALQEFGGMCRMGSTAAFEYSASGILCAARGHCCSTYFPVDVCNVQPPAVHRQQPPSGGRRSRRTSVSCDSSYCPLCIDMQCMRAAFRRGGVLRACLSFCRFNACMLSAAMGFAAQQQVCLVVCNMAAANQAATYKATVCPTTICLFCLHAVLSLFIAQLAWFGLSSRAWSELAP